MDETNFRIRAIELALQWTNENDVLIDTISDLLGLAQQIKAFITSGTIPDEGVELDGK